MDKQMHMQHAQAQQHSRHMHTCIMYPARAVEVEKGRRKKRTRTSNTTKREHEIEKPKKRKTMNKPK